MTILPDWDSIESTARWSDILFWAGIICLVLLAVTEVASHIYGNRSTYLSNEAARIGRENAKEIADQQRSEVVRLQSELAETARQASDATKQLAVENSLKNRLRRLFASIDPQILITIDAGEKELSIRMQPQDEMELQQLLAEPDGNQWAVIEGYGPRERNSLINNGSLGPSSPVPTQRPVFLKIDPGMRR